MKSMILVVHGSRLESSNDEAKHLADKLAEKLETQYPIFEIAFLELTRPSIAEAIESCIQQGAGEVCLLPYFLCAGHHVIRDIPDEVKQLQQKYPHIPFYMTKHVGSSDLIIDLLCGLARHELPT